MRNSELNKILVDNFPQLRESYASEVSWQEGDSTGSHVVYGDVFTPYLRECLEQNKTDEVKKAFAFLERVLEFNDGYAEEVIALSVLESLAYLFHDQPKLQSMLGAISARILSEVS